MNKIKAALIILVVFAIGFGINYQLEQQKLAEEQQKELDRNLALMEETVNCAVLIAIFSTRDGSELTPNSPTFELISLTLGKASVYAEDGGKDQHAAKKLYDTQIISALSMSNDEKAMQLQEKSVEFQACIETAKSYTLEGQIEALMAPKNDPREKRPELQDDPFYKSGPEPQSDTEAEPNAITEPDVDA